MPTKGQEYGKQDQERGKGCEEDSDFYGLVCGSHKGRQVLKGFLQFACTGGKVILAPCNFGNLLQGGLVYLQAEIARAGLQFELDTAALRLGLPIPPEWDGVPVYEAFGLPVERQSTLCE